MASFFSGVYSWLVKVLGQFSIIYFRGLGLRIGVRVWVRVRVGVRVWVRVRVMVRVERVEESAWGVVRQKKERYSRSVYSITRSY